MRIIAFAFPLFLIAQMVSAERFSIADLTVAKPLATATLPTANSAAGYLTVTNSGTTPDRLVAVEAPFTRVEIHDVTVEDLSLIHI